MQQNRFYYTNNTNKTDSCDLLWLGGKFYMGFVENWILFQTVQKL